MTTEKRAVLYLRVSSDEQAERGTIENQRTWLQNYVRLYGLDITATYEDEGWSGTLALQDRPAGRRLLEDAQAGQFSEVVVYRLDRLGRSLATLLKAHDALQAAGVSVRSASEPFDTGTPVGRLMFQLLGSIAEWERASLAERTTQGRERRAHTGRWSGGVVPLGYDVDPDGYLVPSERVIEILGITEAELVRDIFARIAGGSSGTAEALRLNALGVPSVRRYAGLKKGPLEVATPSGLWGATRLQRMIRDPVYKGRHAVEMQSGPIERSVPPLVTPEVWEAAGRQLARNQKLAKRNAQRLYLLRGLIECGNCGRGLSGDSPGKRSEGDHRGYYRCTSSTFAVNPDHSARCQSKRIPAQPLEDAVWQDCRGFILNPGQALAKAQQQLRERMEQSTTAEAERRALLQRLNDHEQSRERVMVLFRRGRITLEEADAQLEAANGDVAEARAQLDALTAQADLLKAWESRVTDAAVLLSRLQDRLEEVERTNDYATKRQIVEMLVQKITVRTLGEGRDKTAAITIHYSFGDPHALTPAQPGDSGIVPRTRKCGRPRRCWA